MTAHRGEAEMRPQRADNVLGVIRLIGVPHKADGNNFRAVHEDSSDLDLLAAVALKDKDMHKNETIT